MKYIAALQLILLTLIVSSCVSGKKYKELESRYQKANIDAQGSENRLDALKAENERLRREITQAELDNKDLKVQINQRENLKIQQLEEWRQKYDNLNTAYQQLLQNSTQEANVNRQIIQQKDTQLSQITGNQTGNTPQNPFDQNLPAYTAPSPNTTQLGGTNALENKSFTNTGLINSNLENTDYTGNTLNQAALVNLQNQLSYVMEGFQKNEAFVEMNNGNIYLHFADPVLFSNQKYELSPKAVQAIKNISTILKNNRDVDISLISDDNQADANLDALLKTESIARLLQAEGLSYHLHKKNFAPLAFNTTGTEVKIPHTSLIIRLR